MDATLQFICILSGLVVLAEALDQLERMDLGASEDVLGHVLKALAWGFLAIGGAGAVFVPALLAVGMEVQAIDAMHLDHPSITDACTLAGVAVLVVRSRIKRYSAQPGELTRRASDWIDTERRL